MEETAPQRTDEEEALSSNSGLISILSVGRASLGRDLRLKVGDVIIAVDGVPFSHNIDRFEDFLKNFESPPAMLTIFRDGNSFEVFVDGPLGCTYAYADEMVSEQVNDTLSDHKPKSKESIRQYEAMRNIRREVKVYDTSYSPWATIFPALWLLYHRMWEPMGVVIVTYLVSALIQPALFVMVYVLISIYMHKAHIQLLRSYLIFSEYYFWMIFTASSTKEAQKLLRSFDKKCSFSYSYVPPPEK